jgi:hypothetical protein
VKANIRKLFNMSFQEFELSLIQFTPVEQSPSQNLLVMAQRQNFGLTQTR